MEQRSDAWFQMRLGKATASRFHDIMVGSKYAGWKNYKAQLVVERLTGVPSDSYQSPAMAWGVDNEPLARLMYVLKTRNQVEECGFFEHGELAAGASPDGLIGKDGVLEVKCPNTATMIETLQTGQVPKVYYAQIQGQMWITGRKWADFVSFDPRLSENAKIIIIPVPRDDIYIEKLEANLRLFLEEVDKDEQFVRHYGIETK
jgi:putative phage-type endonuclease